ncbi:MAG: flagellar M-ring protein FliF C-terminal domain-containing protein, partial [Planctomycetota bacterium]|nr:flagellar M-ring protein FliF C-terminal domain-containing protein [Planctomycetota bacterium]
VRNKLLQLLTYIPGVVVQVTAQVDVRRTETTTDRVLPSGDGTVTAPKSEITSERSSTIASNAAAPGVRSNVGLDIERGGASQSGERETVTEAELETEFGRQKQHVIDPSGRPTRINATINVPRSYFVGHWRMHQGGDDPAADPDEAALLQTVQQEIERIRRDVEPIVETSTDDGATAGVVVVSMIPDPPAAPAEASSGGGGFFAGSTEGGVLASGLFKTVLLGGLAVAALALMFVSLRKATKPVELPTAEELVGVPPALASNEDMFGEADEADSALSGVELSDADLQRREMVDQVSTLVRERPRDAAAMLTRWIRADD